MLRAVEEMCGSPADLTRYEKRRNTSIRVFSTPMGEVLAKEEVTRGADAARAGFEGLSALQEALADCEFAIAPRPIQWRREPPMLVMELVEGVTLQQDNSDVKSHTAGAVLRHLHDRNVFHDDFTPTNLLWSSKGTLCVFDPPLKGYSGERTNELGKYLLHVAIAGGWIRGPRLSRAGHRGYAEAHLPPPNTQPRRGSTTELRKWVRVFARTWMVKTARRGQIRRMLRALPWYVFPSRLTRRW